MAATLTVLGAGAILPRAGYGCAGYALRPAEGAPVTLLDCGPGTIRNLAAAGIGVAEIERVVLSHWHLDHCLDLFALAFARHNPGLGDAPEIELVGPAGLCARMHGAPALLGHWAAMPRATLVEVAPGEPLTRGGLVLRSTSNGHTPEALSWRVADAGGAWSLVYTGDTGPDPRVVELARGVDVLVSECSFPDEAAVPNHLTPTGAAELARAAGARRLVLTHFYPTMDPAEAGRCAARTFDGPIELARDGLVVALTEDRDPR